MVNLETVWTVSTVLVVQAVSLGQEVLERARGRDEWRARCFIQSLEIRGGLASPHALPADLVLVALGLVIWGEATWLEWVLLSAGALIAALVPAPVPALVGLLVFAWLLARISLWPRPEPAPASPR